MHTCMREMEKGILRNKVATSIMLLVFAVSLLTIAFHIEPVRANEVLYIDTDYTFAADVNQPVVVRADNIVIDGAGHTVNNVEAPGSGTGIDLSYRNNVTLKNVEVTNFYYGIYLNSTSNNTLVSNTARNNARGIELLDSSDNTLRGNNASNNAVGIDLVYSSDNMLVGNNASSITGGYGIWIRYSSDNMLVGNTARNSNWGIALSDSSNNTLVSNTASNNARGIELLDSSDNMLVGNNASSNNREGIYLRDSSNNNMLVGNNASSNTGIWDIGYGIILLLHCNNNMLVGNTASSNTGTLEIGIGISLHPSSNNSTVVGNTASNNGDYGIEVWGSSDCVLFHNNLIGNTRQATSFNGANIWDDGYPSGGNYWSDYSSQNPDAEELDGSGIWNTPYVIVGPIQDNYPLMEPWTPVEGAEVYIQIVNETLQDLPNEIVNRLEEDVPDVKHDFSDLFNDALENIDEGNYEGAIEKLNRIEELTYEQIVDSAERDALISMIDGLRAYLETLL